MDRIKSKRFLLLCVFALAWAHGACASDNPIEFKFLGVSVQVIATRLLTFLLGLMGSIAFLFVIGSGILYAASNGNPEAQKKAKGTLITALEGIVLVAFSYILIAFVTKMLTE